VSISFLILSPAKPTHHPPSAQAFLPASRVRCHLWCNAGVSDPRNRRAKRHRDRSSGSPSRAILTYHIAIHTIPWFVASQRQSSGVIRTWCTVQSTFTHHHTQRASSPGGPINRQQSRPSLTSSQNSSLCQVCCHPITTGILSVLTPLPAAVPRRESSTNPTSFCSCSSVLLVARSTTLCVLSLIHVLTLHLTQHNILVSISQRVVC